MTAHPRTARRIFSALAAVALAATLASCSSASGGNAGNANNSAAPSPGRTLTGAPVILGLVNAEEGSLTYPDVSAGARAAVAYLNSHDGINSHPVKLNVCKTDGSAASTISCAHQLISDDAIVSLEGYDPSADAKLAPLKQAGIAVFGVNTLVQGVSVDPNATLTSVPWSLSFPAALKALKAQGAKSLVIIGADPGPQMLKLLTKAVVGAAGAMGMTASLSAYNPASPNFTAAITAAEAKGADAIYISGNETACTNGIKTAKTMGYKGALFVVNCTQFVTTLGTQAKGVLSLSALVPPSALKTAPAAIQAQLKTYEQAMKSDGSGKDLNSFAIYGFSDVMTFADAVKSVPGTLTKASVQDAISKYQGDVFLGQPHVNCAERPVPGGSCGTEMAELKANGDGGFSMLNGAFFPVAG